MFLTVNFNPLLSMEAFVKVQVLGFIKFNVFSERETGFNRRAKLFELNFYVEKSIF